MKTNIEKISNLERRLHIEVPQEEVAKSMTAIFSSIRDQVTIKGFRKGKAPLSTVKSMYGDKAREDVIRNLIEKHYFEALQEHELEPLGNPNIEYDALIENQSFKFSAQFEIRPNIQLTQYENLNVDKERVEVKEEELAIALENLRQNRSKEEPLIIIRPAKEGDLATIDFQGFVNSQLLENSSGSEQTMELGRSGFIPGFDDGICGMNVGDSKNLYLKFPSDYAEDLAGKEVTFAVTLKRLGQKSIPELNDSFAREIGAFENLEQLKNRIREEILAEKEARAIKEVRNLLLKELVAKNPMEVPPSLFASQKKTLVQDLHHKLEEQGMSHEEFEKYIKQWNEDIEESTRFMIKSSFLINEIADKLNLRCTPEEMDERFKALSSASGIDLEKIKQFYKEPEKSSSIRFQITEEKVTSHLLSKANVRIVEPKPPAENANP